MLVNDVPSLTNDASQSHESLEMMLMVGVHLLALIGGIMLLKDVPGARWLLISWMAFHVVLSLYHPLFELFVHGLLLITLAYFFLNKSSQNFYRERHLNAESI
jgi:hypothetical protein